MVQLLQLILNNYTAKTDLDKLSHFYHFFFFHALLRKLPASPVLCREVYDVDGVAYFPCTFSTLEVIFLCLLTVHLLVLSSLTNKFCYIQILWCLVCFTYAGYWFFASSVILNTSTQGCVPVVTNNGWFVLLALGPLPYTYIFKASAIILCLYFWRHLLKSPGFLQQPSSYGFLITWHSFISTYISPFSGVTQ